MNYLRLREDVFWISSIYVVGYFSILRHGISYTDDNIRIITGESLFLYVGRPLSEALTLALHWGQPIFDASPVPQVIALSALVWVSTAFARHCEDLPPWLAVLAGAFIGMNPMIIENMSYKFDAVTMALALALAVVPSLWRTTGVVYFLTCATGALASLMLYQAALGAMIALVAGQMVHAILQRQAPSHYLRRAAEAAAAAILAAVIYKIATSVFLHEYLKEGSWGGDHAKVASLASFPGTAWMNLRSYSDFLYENMITTSIGAPLVGLFAFALFVICIRFSVSRDLKRLLWEAPILFAGLTVIAFSPLGLQIALESPVLQPRSLYGFGVTVAVLLWLSGGAISSPTLRFAVAMPFALLLFQTITVASLLGNMQQQQARWEGIVLSGLANDLADLARTGEDARVRFSGSLVYAPEVRVGLQKHPLLRNMARYHVGDIWSFPALLNTIGIGVEIVKDESSKESLIRSGLGYDIYRESAGNLLVEFNPV